MNYPYALQHFGIETLHQRRQNHLERFALKCTEDIYNRKMFPKNNKVRGKDVLKVIFARTSQYLNSAIPQCQRLLNTKFTKEEQYQN